MPRQKKPELTRDQHINVMKKKGWFVEGNPDECWPWRGPLVSGTTRPRYTSNGGNPLYIIKDVEPSRTSAFLMSCDNPICMNPAHATPTTKRGVWSDRRKKGIPDPIVINADETGTRYAPLQSRVEKLLGLGYIKTTDKSLCWDWHGKTRRDYGAMIYGQNQVHPVKFITGCKESGHGVRYERSCGNKKCVNPYHITVTTSFKFSSKKRGKKTRIQKDFRFSGTLWDQMDGERMTDDTIWFVSRPVDVTTQGWKSPLSF